MDYTELRIRLPDNKVMPFIRGLPDYAHVAGMDNLKSLAPSRKGIGGRKPIPNGEYTPGKGTAAEAVLKYMKRRGVAKPIEAYEGISGFKEKALHSGFYMLIKKGKIVRQPDGSYAVHS